MILQDNSRNDDDYYENNTLYPHVLSLIPRLKVMSHEWLLDLILHS